MKVTSLSTHRSWAEHLIKISRYAVVSCVTSAIHLGGTLLHGKVSHAFLWLLQPKTETYSQQLGLLYFTTLNPSALSGLLMRRMQHAKLLSKNALMHGRVIFVLVEDASKLPLDFINSSADCA